MRVFVKRNRGGLAVGAAYLLFFPTAFFLLGVFNHHYPTLFSVTLIPSLIAVAIIAFAVRESASPS